MTEEGTQTETTEVKTPQTKGQSFVQAVFGQFTDPSFWRDLLRLVVSEMVSSFFMALGGTLLWYGKERRDKKVAEIATGPVNNQSQVANKAFGGGYSPQPSYNGNSYPVPTQQNTNVSFPGFR